MSSGRLGVAWASLVTALVLGALAWPARAMSAQVARQVTSSVNSAAAAKVPLNPFLVAVSCTGAAANACEAVGYDTESGKREVPAAEGWNGTTWSIQTVPDPTGTTPTRLTGVSCTSANSCEAVGSDSGGAGGTAMLAEVWNGATWTIQTTPSPTGANYSLLSSVSCSSPDECEAVGNYFTGSGAGGLLGEVWNGRAWSVQTIPTPAGSTNADLTGLSCVPSGTCEGVGVYETSSVSNLTFAEKFDGTAWSLQKTSNPSPNGVNDFLSVSCPTGADCRAVGYYKPSTAVFLPLAEVWNGTGWRVQTAPGSPGVTTNQLNGVSCTAVDDCEAVGFYMNGSHGKISLAEVWNGTTWSIQDTPVPVGSTNNPLFGVACTSADVCETVGSYSADGHSALADSWDGMVWSVQAMPK